MQSLHPSSLLLLGIICFPSNYLLIFSPSDYHLIFFPFEYCLIFFPSDYRLIFFPSDYLLIFLFLASCSLHIVTIAKPLSTPHPSSSIPLSYHLLFPPIIFLSFPPSDYLLIFLSFFPLNNFLIFFYLHHDPSI